MKSPINILVAFPYFKKEVVELLKSVPRDCYRLVVDSGAFTAWNLGRVIDLDNYCRFLDSIEHLRPFNAVQLDVFGNPDETWKNFLIMKKRGYNTMPVFTRGDSLDRLEEMYKLTDYIMFGGIVTGGKNLNYVKWFQENNKDRKVHWLGFCDSDFIKFYRPYSVDSSSWASGHRFGTLNLYRGYGRGVTITRKKLLTHPPEEIFKAAKNSGITMSEMTLLQNSECWTGSTNIPDLTKPEKSVARFIGTMAQVHRGMDIEKNIGTKFYFACSNFYDLRSVLVCRDMLIERGVINGQLSHSKQRSGTKVIRSRKDRLPNHVHA